MAQEFRINSSTIEAKINQLLPSQGGQGAGVDFSASTMVIPIVDLTESAEGSNLRVDLQSALNFTGATVFDVTNTTNCKFKFETQSFGGNASTFLRGDTNINLTCFSVIRLGDT